MIGPWTTEDDSLEESSAPNPMCDKYRAAGDRPGTCPAVSPTTASHGYARQVSSASEQRDFPNVGAAASLFRAVS
ncbi:hypothetical protein ANO14919_009230 [Xylariales sp. No.14919]|nr:hypothetical protein ANO14919_009230 [Xylariales sp. No.14919]